MRMYLECSLNSARACMSLRERISAIILSTSTRTIIHFRGNQKLAAGSMFIRIHLVSFQTRSAGREYDWADQVRRVGNRYKPLNPWRQACQSCGQSHSSHEDEAEAVATEYACSFAAVEGVVSGSRNQLVAGEGDGGRWVAAVVAVAAMAPSVRLAVGA